MENTIYNELYIGGVQWSSIGIYYQLVLIHYAFADEIYLFINIEIKNKTIKKSEQGITIVFCSAKQVKKMYMWDMLRR